AAIFDNDGRNMFSETTESPLSSTSVNNLGGAEAAEIIIYPFGKARLARHLRCAKKKPPHLAGAHGLTTRMPLRAHARVSYYDDRKCHFGKPRIFECPARRWATFRYPTTKPTIIKHPPLVGGMSRHLLRLHRAVVPEEGGHRRRFMSTRPS